ncbi:MAG TPA: phage tail tube protein, partial [Mycobacteriales bacterium]|nr:phage tail tube protein [Mycobacteriales bacterium]
MEGTGIDAQIGFAAEAAYGQFAAPTRFLPFRSEALTTEHARKVAEGLRPGRYGLRRGERRRGTINPSGDVVFDFADVGFGLLLQHMMGSVDTDEVEAGAVWDHTFTPGSLRELSLTAQVGVPDVEGTSNPKSVTGCKVTGWELGVSVDEYAQLTLSLVGQNESWSEALAAPVYP